MLRSLAYALPLSLALAVPTTAQTPLSLEVWGDIGSQNGHEWLASNSMAAPHALQDALIQLKVNCDPGWWTIVVFRVWAANTGSPGFPYDTPTGFAQTMQTTYGFTPAPSNQTISSLPQQVEQLLNIDDLNALANFELTVAPEQVSFYGNKFLDTTSAHLVKNWAQPILTGGTSLTWDGSPGWFTGQTAADNDYEATWKNIQLGSDTVHWLDVAAFADVAASRQSTKDFVNEDDYGDIVAAGDLYITMQPFAFKAPSSNGGSSATATPGITNNPKPRFRVGSASTIQPPSERVARGREADTANTPMLVTPGSLTTFTNLGGLDGHTTVWFHVQGGGQVERPMFKVGASTGMVRIPSNVTSGFIDIESSFGTLCGATADPSIYGPMFVTPLVPNNP